MYKAVDGASEYGVDCAQWHPLCAIGESGRALGAAARPNVAVSPHYSGQTPTARPIGRF